MHGSMLAMALLAAAAPAGSWEPASSRVPASVAAAPAPIPLAITVDDLPAHGPLPPGYDRARVVRALAAAFRAEGVPAFGFLNAGFGYRSDGTPEPGRDAAVAAWRAAGLDLGNHTRGHVRLDAVGADAFLAEVAANEAPLAAAAPPGRDWHWLRYPFLNEGEADVRERVRATLRARGYRVAGVSMSFADYDWQAPYAACLAAGDRRGAERLRRGFLADARAAALAARPAPGRAAVPQVLLLHAGALDADVMPELLRMYRDMGFRFTALAEVEADPYWSAAVDLSRPGPTPAPVRAVLKGPAQPCRTGHDTGVAR